MTKSTKKSKCFLVLNVDMGNESIEEYVRPVHEDDDVLLDVECGPNKAILYLSKLCTGSKGPCVSFQSSWLTPNEFQYVSGRETAKDWKRSIRHQGKSIKLLLSKGILVFKPVDNDNKISEDDKKTKKKHKSGKRKKHKIPEAEIAASDATSVSTPDSQLQETESQSSISTIDNSYTADDQCDTVSESEKQTDDSINGGSDKDLSGDGSSSKDPYQFSDEPEDMENGGKYDRRPVFKDFKNSVKPTETEFKQFCDKEETDDITGNGTSDDTCNHIVFASSPNNKNSDKKYECDLLPSAVKEETSCDIQALDSVTPADDITHKDIDTKHNEMAIIKETADVTDIECSEKLRSETLNIKNVPELIDKRAQMVDQECVSGDNPFTASDSRDGKLETDFSEHIVHNEYITDIQDNKIETNSNEHDVVNDKQLELENISMKDDTNNNITEGEEIRQSAYQDGGKGNPETDIISQDELSPQERNVSPPRESRLQNIIEQLRVSKQKGMDSKSNSQESNVNCQSIGKTPQTTETTKTEDGFKGDQELKLDKDSECSSNNEMEGINSCISNNETEENSVTYKVLHEENSCSRTEGRFSVKNKELSKSWHRQQGNVSSIHGLGYDKNTLHLDCSSSEQEGNFVMNKLPEQRIKRSCESQESYHASVTEQSKQNLGNLYSPEFHKQSKRDDDNDDSSGLLKPYKGNEYINLTKPSKSDIIVNGLLDSIYTEKKREKQIRVGKPDSRVNSDRPLAMIDSKTKKMDMLPDGRHKIASLPSNIKQFYDHKRTEVDSARNPKYETKPALHVKTSHRNQEHINKSNLPTSPKSGSTYPSSYINLKSKDIRYDNYHGQTETASCPQKTETKSENSPSHHENVYNDYMRLLAATQSSLHLIPHPALDPYFMMRLSESSYPYMHPHLHKSSSEKTDSPTNPFSFMNPSFPPLGMLPPGWPLGLPPLIPDAYKVPPSTGSTSKKSSVSPVTSSAKRPLDTHNDALDLSAKRIKIGKSREDPHNDKQSESHILHHKRQQSISPDTTHKQTMSKQCHDDRSSSKEYIDYRKLHNSWIDKSGKTNKLVCTCSSHKMDDIRHWSVEKVCRFISKLDGCSSYAEVFREHRLDGKRLPLLTTEQLVKSLGMKVGPAITLSEAVTRKIQAHSRNFQPCDYCKRKSHHQISI